MGAFLYPNQYVKFDASSQVVAAAKDLSANCHDDLEVIISVYNYVVENITYDYDKAENVKSGYIPDVDEILRSKRESVWITPLLWQVCSDPNRSLPDWRWVMPAKPITPGSAPM